MTADTQKIDVLAVMDRLHHYLLLASNVEAQKRMHPLANSMEARAFNLIEDAKEARAAVADLIKAAERSSARALVLEMALKSLLGETSPGLVDKATRIITDLESSLARIGGSP